MHNIEIRLIIKSAGDIERTVVRKVAIFYILQIGKEKIISMDKI